MELDTLQALYVEGLRDLYSAENQLIKAMPKMTKAAKSPELKEAFETHLAQTEQQVQRLEKLFADLKEKPTGKHCKGMEGLIEEGNELMGEDADPDVMDAGLIAAAQHIEHYEMAGYGTCRTYAELLGLDDHMELLQQTLNEEEETDQILTEIALTSVNLAAMEGDGEEEDEEGEEGEEGGGGGGGGGGGSRSSSGGRSGSSGGGSKTASKTASKSAGKSAGKTAAKKSAKKTAKKSAGGARKSGGGGRSR